METGEECDPKRGRIRPVAGTESRLGRRRQAARFFPTATLPTPQMRYIATGEDLHVFLFNRDPAGSA